MNYPSPFDTHSELHIEAYIQGDGVDDRVRGFTVLTASGIEPPELIVASSDYLAVNPEFVKGNNAIVRIETEQPNIVEVLDENRFSFNEHEVTIVRQRKPEFFAALNLILQLPGFMIDTHSNNDKKLKEAFRALREVYDTERIGLLRTATYAIDANKPPSTANTGILVGLLPNTVIEPGGLWRTKAPDIEAAIASRLPNPNPNPKNLFSAERAIWIRQAENPGTKIFLHFPVGVYNQETLQRCTAQSITPNALTITSDDTASINGSVEFTHSPLHVKVLNRLLASYLADPVLLEDVVNLGNWRTTLDIVRRMQALHIIRITMRDNIAYATLMPITIEDRR